MADNDGVRTLAVTLASIFVVGSALAALYMALVALFPYESRSSDELREHDWLVLAAPVVLGLAVATLVFVVKRKTAWASLSLVGQAIVGLVVFRALDELTYQSDTELTAFALSIAVVGTCAVIASLGQEANA